MLLPHSNVKDVNSQYDSALLLATKRGWYELAKDLLSSSSPRYKDVIASIDARDRWGDSALAVAIKI